MRRSGPRGAPARARAAEAVAAVVQGRGRPERVLGAVDETQRDGALIRALTMTALRWHHRLEWQLGQLLERPLGAADAKLGALLRVGLAQLQWFRVPDHAAVAATVGAAPLVGRGHAKALVNAVLRRFLRERAQLDSRMQADRVALTSHPQWIVDAIEADWPEQADAILAANNERAPMWLRVNARRMDREGYLERLAAAGIEAEPGAAGPSAVLLAEPRPMRTLPGYAEGLVSVQDGAAQAAAGYLGAEPGMRVLDGCAAPGGKAAHVAESCPGLAELVALERDGERLATMRRELERLGLEARLVQADATDTRAWWDGEPFDRVLVDAPCSALGVLRRHPDIKLRRTPGDVAQAVALQAELLERLWSVLAPGGRMLYVTCTVLARENGRQIERFAARTAGVELAGPGPAGGLQRLPGETGMDGFYYASMTKRSDTRSA